MPNRYQQKTSPLQTNLQEVLAEFGIVEGEDYQTATLQDVAAIEDYYPSQQNIEGAEGGGGMIQVKKIC